MTKEKVVSNLRMIKFAMIDPMANDISEKQRNIIEDTFTAVFKELEKDIKLKAELKQILQKIKDDCVKRDDCNGCKFFSEYGCAVKDIPQYWNTDVLGGD